MVRFIFAFFIMYLFCASAYSGIVTVRAYVDDTLYQYPNIQAYVKRSHGNDSGPYKYFKLVLYEDDQGEISSGFPDLSGLVTNLKKHNIAFADNYFYDKNGVLKSGRLPTFINIMPTFFLYSDVDTTEETAFIPEFSNIDYSYVKSKYACARLGGVWQENVLYVPDNRCTDPNGTKTAIVTNVNSSTDTATVAFVSRDALAHYEEICNNSGGVWWDDGFNISGFGDCHCNDNHYFDSVKGCIMKAGLTSISVWLKDVPVSTIKSECNRLGGTYDDNYYLCNHPTKTFVVTEFNVTDFTPTFGFIDNDAFNDYKLMCFTSGSLRRSAGAFYCHCDSETMIWDGRVGCTLRPDFGVEIDGQDFAEFEMQRCNSYLGTFDTELRVCKCNDINNYGVPEHAIYSFNTECKTCSSLNAIYVSNVGAYGACKKCPDKVDVEHNTCVTSCGSGQKYIENEYKTVRLCVPNSYIGTEVK